MNAGFRLKSSTITFCGCMGVVLAVNVEAVEGSNMSNVCALNRSQKRCLMMFYYVLNRFICLLLPLLC